MRVSTTEDRGGLSGGGWAEAGLAGLEQGPRRGQRKDQPEAGVRAPPLPQPQGTGLQRTPRRGCCHDECHPLGDTAPRWVFPVPLL